MARKLSQAFLNTFKDGGYYHELLEVVKNDPDLEFEIRVKDEVMIYFEKCKLLTIQHRQTQQDNIVMLDNKYIYNRKDSLTLTSFLSSPDDLADRLKIEDYFLQAKKLVRNYKRHDEFLVQQEFKKTHDSFDDDYMVVDMEWTPDQADVPVENRIEKTRIDLIVISNHVNSEGYNDVFLAELKYGLGAADGQSGMEDHLRKSKLIIGNPMIYQKLMNDVWYIVRQKRELGLLKGEPVNYKYPNRPKMMFILAYKNEIERKNFENRVLMLSGNSTNINTEYLHVAENDNDINYQLGRDSLAIYDNDTTFKSACRKHQALFRANTLHLPMGENIRTHKAVNESEKDFEIRRKTITDITHITDEDAMRLMNFVPAFHNEIYKALYQRYDKIPTSHDLMNDMLRSECIPWNFFVPMMQDKDAAVRALRLVTNRNDINKIVEFKIEYNPKTLGDNTAFDAFFRYVTKNEEYGIVGIETKYTEEGYNISPTEKARIENPNSFYCQTMHKSGCFNTEDSKVFDCPEFIQIWRNHLLAISMSIKGQTKYFDSVTIYPSGNTHFCSCDNHVGALDRYSEYLSLKGKNTFHHCTFEYFVKILSAIYTGSKNAEWLDYIRKRYIYMEEKLSSKTNDSSSIKVIPNLVTAELPQKTITSSHFNSSNVNKYQKSHSDYSLLLEGRKEWVLNLVDYKLYDMINSGEAKAKFTYDAPFTSGNVADKLKYPTVDSFISAYNKERKSTNDKKNKAYWNFCRKVNKGDIIYLAKGPLLFAFGLVIGDDVETQYANMQHVWKVKWHIFNNVVNIDSNIATPFFIELTDNTKTRKRSSLRTSISKQISGFH